MPIELPDSDDSDDESTVNPLSSVPVVVQQASQYEGKFGAPRGPGAVSVVVLPGRGLMTDRVTIMDQQGNKKAEIPYTELHSFHVITGEGKRKPAISFEHKPIVGMKGCDVKVWMKQELATDCAEKLMKMLQALARHHEFEQEFSKPAAAADGIGEDV